MHVQLIRVHEDGSCARWTPEPDALRIVLVVPAKGKRPRVPGQPPDAGSPRGRAG